MSEKPRKHFVILGFDKEEQAERYFKRTSYGRIDGCNMASLNIKHTEIGQRLEEENKKLREERDKLVECVKEIRDFKASPLRSETEHIWEICDQTLKDIGEV